MFRSPLFILGLAAVPAVVPSGCRSMLAFWAGGACAPAAVVPPPSGGGGGGIWIPDYREQHPPDTDDDDLIPLLTIIALTLRHA